ncbi:molybdopterin molybdenumtransferase [Rhodococcoides trifolii]|uniref:Molybdopterin molybdenumtransferase n=1 Tax=Rhodococcoides trifolii TaxID=908250 RepID=A0A917D0V1_9NOCA|nr:gephyrin-like molybdotransferase Glp [Rhodococcus trifolii]GGG05935.1 molybdopterin molybdenumtransferase [Rhodococcus trifolii]
MSGAHVVSPPSVDEHSALIASMLGAILEASTEESSVSDALGRVVAESVLAPVDLPLFRNSQMDGFAVDAVSVASAPVALDILGTIAAGDPVGDAHVPGTARRIMTGAPVPDGADAIVPVEDTDVRGDTVTVRVARRTGEFVRDRGSDISAGSTLLPAGVVLRPRHLGALAAAGLSVVPVRRRPRVAVIATGKELVDVGHTLGPGQIYDSNGLTLATSVIDDGGDVVFRARSTDSLDEFSRILRHAIAVADVVLTSGGVSMGDFEVVRDVLTPLGGRFGHVAMQPGGPQGTATVEGTPILNFPGNPVSTLVSYIVFARPLIRRAAGLPVAEPEFATLDAAVRSVPGRRQFLRGQRTPTGVVTTRGAGSHLVATMASADVLVDIPADVVDVAPGTRVRVWEL